MLPLRLCNLIFNDTLVAFKLILEIKRTRHMAAVYVFFKYCQLKVRSQLELTNLHHAKILHVFVY